MLSELLSETEAFVDQVQVQFEGGHSWDMSALECGLREALLKDGCHILEGLLNQPHALGRYTPAEGSHDTRSNIAIGDHSPNIKIPAMAFIIRC